MSTIIEQATRGHRKAMQALYEANKQKVYYVSRLLLGGYDAEAARATNYTFKQVWSSLPAHGIETEEEFTSLVIRKASDYCKREISKQNQKAFRIPQNRNFLIVTEKGLTDGCENNSEDALSALPPLQRFIFVLHNVADFLPEQIAGMFKFDMKTVGLALDAEKTNIERVVRRSGENKQSYDWFVRLIRDSEDKATVPDWVDQNIAKVIDHIATPIEAKQKNRITIFGVSAILAILLIIGIGFMISSGNNDVDYTSGDGTETSDTSTDTTSSTLISEPVIDLDEMLTYYADIEIENYGTITVKLDQETAPVTVSNFINLAQNGFYDGLTFHRIIEDFMMQGGCPNGDGYGSNTDEDGNEINIVGEFTSNGYENSLSHTRGAISMARSDAYNSASSQFFIVHEDSTDLDGDYAVFGYVTEGMDVVDAVCESAEPTDGNGTISAEDQPIITSITIRTEQVSDSSGDTDVSADTTESDTSAE